MSASKSRGFKDGTQRPVEQPRHRRLFQDKYIGRYGSEEQIAQFINGLFQKAAEARYTGNWEEFNKFGQPLGEPHNHHQHCVIVEDALRLLATATEPGTVLQLPYRWRCEDYTKVRQERGSMLISPPVPTPSAGQS